MFNFVPLACSCVSYINIPIQFFLICSVISANIAAFLVGPAIANPFFSFHFSSSLIPEGKSCVVCWLPLHVLCLLANVYKISVSKVVFLWDFGPSVLVSHIMWKSISNFLPRILWIVVLICGMIMHARN